MSGGEAHSKLRKFRATQKFQERKPYVKRELHVHELWITASYPTGSAGYAPRNKAAGWKS